MNLGNQLADLLAASRSTVAFTGAGISTESGIPDFRSPGGVWQKYRPVYFDDFMASEEARREYWRQKCEAHEKFLHASPNQGHRVLADWEQRGRIRGIITQNIDGLHQIAGNREVLELHGTARWAACMSCWDRQPIQPLVDKFLATGKAPLCAKCAGPMKHATISFGQSLPADVLEKSLSWMERADLVLVLGSSLAVQPAADLPRLAVEHGAKLVVINRDPTPLDSMAELVGRQPLGQTLLELDATLVDDSPLSQQIHDRRKFLQVAALAIPTIVPSSALGLDGATAPSERLQLGVIGLGARGLYLLDEFLNHKDVRVNAICDVHKHHYRDNAWGKGRVMGLVGGKRTVVRANGVAASKLIVTDDFREVCENDGLDAVVVATPDHWHAHCTLAAIRAGKDVYCEKPLTHTFAEGQLIYQKAGNRQTVFQTGSQQRSDALFRKAVELVINGHIGTLKHIEIGLPPGYDKPMGDATETAPPEDLDYDRWCGPAPLLPYMRARHHRWWRGHRAYGGGVLMDWIGHHNDIAHWSLGIDRSGPIAVEAVGWKFPNTDVYDSPRDCEIRCEYQGKITSSISSHHRVGTKWIGEDGWVYVNRGKLEASEPSWLKPAFVAGPKRLFVSPGHIRNFLDCVRSRESCIAPSETAHRSITPGHLGYVSHAVGRRLKWDAEAEQIVGDDQANELLRRNPYRSPWSVS